MEYRNILFDVTDGIATVTLNRPKYLNALCSAVNGELEDVLGSLACDPAIRVLILTGGSAAFAAGADISEIADASALDAERISRKAQRINDMLEGLPIPVIAAVNGLALGGGLELALACDFRVMAEDAVLGLPEVSLGILPGAGGTQRLARLIGAARAKEVIMMGRRIKGKEALELGLATVAVPAARVMDEALSLAQKLKDRPAAALRLAKAAVNAGENHGSDVGKHLERLLFSMSFTTEDHREGLRAFQEKRAPQYHHAR